jgi:signal transduction histidine kinase
MIVSKKEIDRLSADVRQIIDGQKRDLRDNQEGKLSILKNDIHILANRLNEQADSLRADKESMARALADISHQIKTPLTSAIIMADLLADAPPDKQTEFAGNIRTALLRTQWMITALLKMAKLETGTAEFTHENIDARELIRSATEPLQILCEVKNQHISVSGEAALRCDRHWTTEALTNVIKNALETSPNGTTISISAGSDPICAWICVRDSGGGIPRSELPLLFRRFEGGRKQQGFGIGLPLALAILRRQNGDIEVDPGGNGQGAAFTLKFYK